MTNDYETNDKSSFRNGDPLYNLSSENSKLEEENQNLKRTIQFYQTEIEKFRHPPFVVSELISITKKGQAIVKLPNHSNFVVNISGDCPADLKAGDMVINEQKSLVIMDRINLTKNFPVENYLILNKNINISWKDIGGLKKEIREVKEVLELPLMNPTLFKKIGITPPKGVLLHGEPGTGKTMIAKALAKQTNATVIELVGSELVQKFIGEGAKLVKELFQLAREKAPTIIFIDELDAIAAKRIETGTSGEREVNRTFMQLLGEIDGFDPLSNVKIIAATNRIDILDSAILRPGRLERHIEIGEPDEEGRLEILKIHTKNMKFDKDIDLEQIAKDTKKFSGAQLQSLTTESGYLAMRENRTQISQKDLEAAIQVVKSKEEEYEILTNSFN